MARLASPVRVFRADNASSVRVTAVRIEQIGARV